MRYAVVVEKAESNFAAYVPDLPGCIATGRTIEETEQLIQEAIVLHLRGMREDGLVIPEPSRAVGRNSEAYCAVMLACTCGAGILTTKCKWF